MKNKDLTLDAQVAVEESGEALASVVGIVDAMLGKVKFSDSTIMQSTKVGKKVSAAIKEFLNEPFSPIKLELKDYDFRKLYDAVFEVRDVDWLAAAIENVPLDQAAIVSGKLLELIEILKNVTPRLPMSIASSKARINEFEVSRFNQTLRVLDEPLELLKELNMGCLSRGQVVTLATAYPNLYQLINETLQLQATELVAKDPEFQLPWEKLKQVSVLMLSNTIPADLQGLLQSNFQKEDATEQAARMDGVDIAKVNETKVNRLENK